MRVNDPDFDISGSGEDVINLNNAGTIIGPVEISVIRGSNTVILGHAGGPTAIDGVINVGTTLRGDGIIAPGELTYPLNTGFVSPDATITITQAGATAAAFGTWVDCSVKTH